ncbi:hypothetical protein CANCADRAFT_144647 [Tortispora caseinolytica NRRL Y-17796]|uniref:PH domain-containing protein n=1 Tax=Tortispora caseinolytica NRRL Y-17796 TaxID=767744 RepID=A0A1E4T9C3_9ASCO|nr:hypothetical protein CANCADRAFT_144647 [Tortispora caseinolytica NRRL Y-17796]
MDPEKEALNLRVVKLHDKEAQNLLFVGTFTVVYKFDSANSSWEKMPIQGPLFFYTRHQDPKVLDYGAAFLVLNQHKPEDLFIRLVKPSAFLDIPSIESQIDDKFVMIKLPDGTIHSFWFANPEESKNLHSAMSKWLSES